jgi:hypothetical protein
MLGLGECDITYCEDGCVWDLADKSDVVFLFVVG